MITIKSGETVENPVKMQEKCKFCLTNLRFANIMKMLFKIELICLPHTGWGKKEVYLR